jgi:hypothetical protein
MAKFCCYVSSKKRGLETGRRHGHADDELGDSIVIESLLITAPFACHRHTQALDKILFLFIDNNSPSDCAFRDMYFVFNLCNQPIFHSNMLFKERLALGNKNHCMCML